MRKVAFLSMDTLETFECYDHLLVDPLEKLNWKVETISWKQSNVDWEEYDSVIVRSTWDYQDDVDTFIKKLELINSKTHLENIIDIMKWNIDKSYLRELEENGIKIVPSIWRESFVSEEEFSFFFDKLDADEIIIKPTVSANADNTFLLKLDNLDTYISILDTTFKNRPFIVQPFINNIITEGEYSLFYFGGKYSHAILKTPKENDFRVQEEHGGILKLVKPNKAMQIKSKEILNKLEHDLLYARIDFVRTDNNEFALMELELIEPSLYFNMDPQSPERFAKTFDEWMQ